MCKFEQPEIDFLGYNVSSQGIRPLQPKIDAIRNFPTPKNQKQLLHYLGAVKLLQGKSALPATQSRCPCQQEEIPCLSPDAPVFAGDLQDRKKN